jgi:hypothetical protein
VDTKAFIKKPQKQFVIPGKGTAQWWPLDAPTTIAALSLLISAGQFIATTPLITEMYFKPRLVVTRSYSAEDQTIFNVYNAGRSTAREVEVRILALDSDEISLHPDFGGKITSNESVKFLTYKVELPRLDSHEQFRIVVKRQKGSLVWMEGRVISSEIGAVRIGPIPFVVGARAESTTVENYAASAGENAVTFDPSPLDKEN